MSVTDSRSRQLVKLLVTLSTAAALTVGMAAPARAEPSVPEPAPSVKGPSANAAGGLYIVELVGAPVVAYTGGVPGLGATRPAPGKKIDPLSADVVKYVGHLNARQDAALAAAGGGRKVYSYAYTYNGFAAALTPEQAAKLAQQPGVLSVTANEVQHLETSSTPDFLGLTAPGGLYEQLGGIGSAGEDVIIGVVDGGVWPENPTFSDRPATAPTASWSTARSRAGTAGACPVKPSPPATATRS